MLEEFIVTSGAHRRHSESTSTLVLPLASNVLFLCKYSATKRRRLLTLNLKNNKLLFEEEISNTVAFSKVRIFNVLSSMHRQKNKFFSTVAKKVLFYLSSSVTIWKFKALSVIFSSTFLYRVSAPYLSLIFEVRQLVIFRFESKL